MTGRPRVPSSLSPAAQSNVRRILDAAARRLLAEQLARSLNDHDPAGNRAVEKASAGAAHNAV